MLNTKEFQKNLVENGLYNTLEPRRSLLDKLFGRSDLWYYSKLFKVVVFCSRTAAAHEYLTADQWADASYRMLLAVEACGGKINLSGFENRVGYDGPVVYISNHMSLIETLLLPVVFLAFDYPAFVVKKSLLDYPIFGSIMRGSRPISVGRNSPKEDLKTVLSSGMDYLANGRSVCIFPQHTRSVEFVPSNFNTLGVKLAERAGVPIVPVALKTDFHQNGKKHKDFGRINRKKVLHFKCGAPVRVNENAKDLHKEIIEFIQLNLKQWGSE